MTAAVPAAAATLLPGFAETRLATGMTNVTAMSIAPDGRVFVSQQAGQLRLVKNGVLQAAPALTLTVDSTNERGLLGTAFDPSFPAEPYIYIYYTRPNPGARNVVSRFTVVGDVVDKASEQVLYQLPLLGPAPIHNSGSLHFSPLDGKLYITVGENSFGPHSQNLDTTFGKLLRINKDGSIPADNPFYRGPANPNGAIWAYGLRNPFTFAIQPGTGRIFVNDVGDKFWDEINDIQKGGNYGWPETEGPHDNPNYEHSFAYLPWSTTACTVIGAAFYNPAVRNFPASYVGKYFYGDLCGGFINVVDPATAEITPFVTGIGNSNVIVDIDVAPDGKLYYLVRATGSVFQVFLSDGTPHISVMPPDQLVSDGETVTLTCEANGVEPLSYEWLRNGVLFGSGKTITFVATLADDGAIFTCEVRNDYGSESRSMTLRVTADKTPNAWIITPETGTQYRAGGTIFFSGDAFDNEDGALPASAFTWEIVFDHASHNHPAMAPISGIKSGSYSIPNIGEQAPNVGYRVILRVRDSAGLVRQVDRVVPPETTTVSVFSSPTGRQVKLDGVPRLAPFSLAGVVGMQRLIDAPRFQQEAEGSPVWYELTGWSDGGAAAHNVTLQSEGNDFTAAFNRVVNPPCITPPALSRMVTTPFPEAQTGYYEIEFDVTPLAPSIDLTLGVADGIHGGLPYQTSTVNFSRTNGRVGPVPYFQDQTYRVRMVVDFVNKLQSAYVTPPGGSEATIRNPTVFRAERLVDTQNTYWGAFVGTNPGTTARVCKVELNCRGQRNTPPSVTPPGPITVRTGAATSCQKLVTDAELGQATFGDNCPSRVVLARSGVPGGNLFPVGTTTVSYTATDSGGLATTVTQAVTVIDDTPPTISGLSADRTVLTPPNHQWETVRLSYTTADNCGPVTVSLVVTSSEPVNGTGDGDTAPDWEIVDAKRVKLRAERAGTAPGRVYTITVVAVDASNNVTTQNVTVHVPHHAYPTN